MNTPTPDSPLPGGPTPDDLAGIPVCHEEKSPPIPTRGTRGGKGRKRRSPHPRGPLPAQSSPNPPTADDLAGTPVAGDGEEDVTLRSRKTRPQQ